MESTSHAAGAPDLKRTRRQKQSTDHRASVDRLPPYSAEMEKGVLGCCLLAPQECLSECVEKLKQGKEAFYDLRHQTIYDRMELMYLENQPIDIITLQQKLKDNGLLDQCGGIPYLIQLQDSVPSAANLSYYLDGLREKYVLRKAINVCTHMIGQIYDLSGTVDELMDQVERDILAIRGNQANEMVRPRDLVAAAINQIEIIHQNAGKITGLSTGYADIDRFTDGMHGGELIIIAAFPGTGKSALAMNILTHNAVHDKIPCAMLTAEMKPVRLMMRAMCSESRVNLHSIRDHFISEDAFPRLTNAAGKLANSPLYIHAVSGHSIGQTMAIARRMKQKFGIKLLAMDYIQLLWAKADTREQEVKKISNGLKDISMELDIPVIALSQLNDEGRLRESRAIGQDAHSIWKLETEKTEQAPESTDGVKVTCRIEKNREGPAPVNVDLMFLKCWTRFESCERQRAGNKP